jgi:phosphate transport system substrate-binding protein
VNGRLVANPYHRWREISPSLPDRPIKLIGPANGHGTREAFVELVLEPSCKQALTDSALAVEEPLAACRMVRNDGGWKDVDDLELTLGKLATDRDSMGILTFSYLEQFGKRIHAATVEGVSASRASIPTGRYPLSRPLFIYVNVGHLGTTQGLADYAAEFVSFCAAGAHGYLADEGLVPLPAQELLAQRAAVARLQR